MRLGSLRIFSSSVLIGLAVAWGCGGDDDVANGTGDGDGGASSSGGSSGSSSGASSSGSSGASSSGGSSSGADGSGPDPNPVMLASGSDVAQLQVIGTRGFANIGDATNGTEKWSTDFTKVGTKLLVDSCPGACSSEPREALAMPSGTVVFAAKPSQSARALYAGDGTPGGTSKLADGAMPAVVVGTKLVFRATNTSIGLSDGTVPGTSTLKNLSHHFFGQDTDSAALGVRALFTMLEDPGGGGSYVRRIYGTDGTSDGTVQVSGGQFVDMVGSTGDVAFLESHFFSPGSFIGTTQFTVTDGTVAGTKTLTGGFLTTPGVSNETVAGGALYFTGRSTQVGAVTAIYKADANAITKVADGSASNMVAFADKATFVSGSKIMQTDGTAPIAIHDAANDAGPSTPANLTPSGGTLWFTVGPELWKLEGSPLAATKIATFANDCPTCSNPASGYVRLWASGARVFALRTWNGQDGGDPPTAMWFSDGTSAGTKLLKAKGATELVPTPTGVMWTNGKELRHEKP